MNLLQFQPENSRGEFEPFLLLGEDSKSKLELGGIGSVFGARSGYVMHKQIPKKCFRSVESSKLGPLFARSLC